jgi:hypothetical protein
MFYDFLTANREEILVRARERVGARSIPKTTELELAEGLPLLLARLGDALLFARASGTATSESVSRPARGGSFRSRGLSVESAIRDYGDLAHVVAELAVELDAPMGVDEFVTLDLCVDDVIACAVVDGAATR